MTAIGEDHRGSRSEPDVRPLGWLALGLALLSAVPSVTYFLSSYTYLVAVLALPLGLVARGDERTRVLGTTAVIVTTLAIIAATAVLVL